MRSSGSEKLRLRLVPLENVKDGGTLVGFVRWDRGVELDDGAVVLGHNNDGGTLDGGIVVVDWMVVQQQGIA